MQVKMMMMIIIIVVVVVVSDCISISEPRRRYKNIPQKSTFPYKISTGGSEVIAGKQALDSIHGIIIGRLQYTCELMEQHGTPSSYNRGKHSNRTNKVPDERKHFICDFIESILI
jgi:hypothetical protein